MKKGIKKCVWCKKWKKCRYKKGKKYFCSPEHKQKYYDNDIPTLIKDIQKEFNSMVTEDQPCTKCGKRFEKMQCSHVWSIGTSPGLRFDIMNVKPLCGHCHNFWWHLEPMESKDWFVNIFPERWKYLEFAKTRFKKWTTEELHKIRQAIKDKNFKELIRFKDEWKNN